MDIIGDQVHPVVQRLFPKNVAFFSKTTFRPYTARSVQSWVAENGDTFQHLPRPAQSPDLKYHRTTMVTFRAYGEKQAPSIISQATGRRVLQYSTRE